MKTFIPFLIFFSFSMAFADGGSRARARDSKILDIVHEAEDRWIEKYSKEGAGGECGVQFRKCTAEVEKLYPLAKEECGLKECKNIRRYYDSLVNGQCKSELKKCQLAKAMAASNAAMIRRQEKYKNQNSSAR